MNRVLIVDASDSDGRLMSGLLTRAGYEICQCYGEDTRHHRPIYEERTAKLKADFPQLEAIISKTQGKEDELKQLKSKLAALDRKITAELTPKHDDNDGTENKQEQSQQHHPDEKTVSVETTQQMQNHNHSMVAEPIIKYSEIYSKGKSEPNTFRKYYKIQDLRKT